jgi:aspartyl-tRNA(Asn)/glutamyl-tRNA(Gln) amidotransferase subunit A
VAAGLVPFALGTDTNGSIRVPSSFCGIWGIKPTYGRLSRGGSFPFVDSLDCIGPFARSVGDLAATYDVMQGPDARDHACTARQAASSASSLDEGLAGLRVAVLGGYFAQGGDPQVHAAVAAVAGELGVTRRVEIAEAAVARAAAFLITSGEAGRLHLSSLKTRAADFDPGMRDRFFAGALLPAAWYLQAQNFRHWFQERMREIFRDVDVLLAPATPVSATRIGQEEMILDGRTMLVRPNLGLFTQPISFVGLPVVAAPVHTVGAMPVAVQLIAAPWREAELLRVARVLERSGLCTASVAPLGV